jgi:glycosyltransferase involved in cell wall biosynthesis
MVNILHIWYSGGIGGTETHILNLIKNSDKNRFSHTVCFLKMGGTISKEIKENGFDVIELNMDAIYNLRTVKSLSRVLGNSRIDIVHNHASTPIVPIIAKRYHKKVIYTEHGNVILNMKNIMLHHILSFIMFLFVDKVIAISIFVKESLTTKRKVPRDKIAVVYHGVPSCKLPTTYMTELSEFNDGALYIGAIGRCIKQKGFDHFVCVAAEFHRRFPSEEVKFVLVGDGSELPLLKKRARLQGVNNRITFLGYRRDIDSLLNKFHLLLITSVAEPFGIVAIEGMSAGLPVIAFDVNGLNEIVLHNKTGYLIKPFDIDEMVKKTSILVRQDNARLQMGNAAFRHFEKNFTINTMVENTEKINQRLIS